MKYVLVTGGVVSGLGKGVTASGIGVLLKGCGFRVTSIKIGEGRRPGPSLQLPHGPAAAAAALSPRRRPEMGLPAVCPPP